MTRTNIVNVINFIRAIEPRDPQRNLLEPVLNQIEIVNQYAIPATWLIQYDALLEDRFVNPLKELGKHHEIGLWFEVVEPLVEQAGLTWRGRYPWDWHSHVGFSIGYAPAEREKLADIFMTKFYDVFGCFPSSVGSWFLDAHLLQYLYDKYAITASCNCKDQWGTDGYSLWGGYFNQAFYPSKRNAFMPAQRVENQIPVPIFRMLGSDPIYQYDCGLGEGEKGTATHCQKVVSLEPAYPDGGGNEHWVKWFCDVNFKAPSLSFGYAQAGQENAFGWAAIEKGFKLQMKLFAEMAARGEIRLETLKDSADWFKNNYPLTPASAVTVLKDHQLGTGDHKTVWYADRFYRCNFYWQGNQFWIRDMHRFDETYAERYLDKTCTTANCTYDTLPILDGFRWSAWDHRAKIQLVTLAPDDSCVPMTSENPEVTEESPCELRIHWDRPRSVAIECRSQAIHVRLADGQPWALLLSWSPQINPPIQTVTNNAIIYNYENTSYQLICRGARVQRLNGHSIQITPNSPDQTVILEPAAYSSNRTQQDRP